eukprot:g4554.t1
MISALARRAASHATRTFSSSSAAAAAAHDANRLIIFDTTLRDGEQSPGATLTTEEKLKIALQLSAMGVDVCEAGFPIASPGDFEAVSRIAKEIGPLTEGRASGKPMRICGLSRANEKDIYRCYSAVKHAPLHRVHTFLATSDIHLEHKLKMTRSECIDKCVEAVTYAKSLLGDGGDIEFSPEDAGRSDQDFLCDVLGAVIEAGATTLNIPDTVGFTMPREYGDMFEYLITNTAGSTNDGIVWSTHCHNDLGLATANTLEGVRGGARQVEVTVNGIGERAGNTSIEEIVMAMRTRPNMMDSVYTDIDSKFITRVSRMVSSFTGMMVQPNKAIVGANAFAHEAGIHQDGMLKNKSTYEIMTPESVGLMPYNNLVLGKHSGKHAYHERLKQLGYTNLDDDTVEDLVSQFKAVADVKKTVTDEDMEAIINDKVFQPRDLWDLVSVHVTAGDKVKPTATVTLRNAEGDEFSEASLGNGPVDAVFKSVQKITGGSFKLTEFTIQSVSDGIDSVGNVIVRISPDDDEEEMLTNPQTGEEYARQFTGQGADCDIIVASARAYLGAINRKEDYHLRRNEILSRAVSRGTQAALQ